MKNESDLLNSWFIRATFQLCPPDILSCHPWVIVDQDFGRANTLRSEAECHWKPSHVACQPFPLQEACTTIAPLCCFKAQEKHDAYLSDWLIRTPINYLVECSSVSSFLMFSLVTMLGLWIYEESYKRYFQVCLQWTTDLGELWLTQGPWSLKPGCGEFKASFTGRPYLKKTKHKNLKLN